MAADLVRKRLRDIWGGMLGRCYRSSHISFPYYGAKGSRVCPEWQGSKGFEQFAQDMGYPPTGMTLDRLNPLGDYSKSNCRWATVTEQNRNRSNVRLYDYNGQRLPLATLAAMHGLSKEMVHHRVIKRGWPIDAALTTKPIDRTKRRAFGLALKEVK